MWDLYLRGLWPSKDPLTKTKASLCWTDLVNICLYCPLLSSPLTWIIVPNSVPCRTISQWSGLITNTTPTGSPLALHCSKYHLANIFPILVISDEIICPSGKSKPAVCHTVQLSKCPTALTGSHVCCELLWERKCTTIIAALTGKIQLSKKLTKIKYLGHFLVNFVLCWSCLLREGVVR